MLVKMLRCKLHRATVTEADLHYQGSLKIDNDLIRAAGFLPNEYIEVYNIDNGERFATYVIEGPAGSGVIGLNGAAARRACIGDRIIICAYAQMEFAEAKKHKPTIVLLGASNAIDRITDKPTVEEPQAGQHGAGREIPDRRRNPLGAAGAGPPAHGGLS